VSAKRQHPQRGQNLSRTPVRIGGLERTLAAFNQEICGKVSEALVMFDGMQVKPLRERIWALEHPFRSRGKKTWAALVALAAWFTKPKEDAATAPGRTAEPQPASPGAGQPGAANPGEVEPSPVSAA
jgi:hypothetical protein